MSHLHIMPNAKPSIMSNQKINIIKVKSRFVKIMHNYELIKIQDILFLFQINFFSSIGLKFPIYCKDIICNTFL